MYGPNFPFGEEDVKRAGCFLTSLVLCSFFLGGIGVFAIGWWLYAHVRIEVNTEYKPTPAPYSPPQGGWHWNEEKNDWLPDPPKKD